MKFLFFLGWITVVLSTPIGAQTIRQNKLYLDDGNGNFTILQSSTLTGNQAISFPAINSSASVIVSNLTGGQTITGGLTINGGATLAGTLGVTGQTSLGSTVLAPSTASVLSDSTDNWALNTSNSYFLISANTQVGITGITGGTAGRVIVLINTGSNPIYLHSDSPGSLAANRFHWQGDGFITLAQDGTATLIYDGTNNYWRLIASH